MKYTIRICLAQHSNCLSFMNELVGVVHFDGTSKMGTIDQAWGRKQNGEVGLPQSIIVLVVQNSSYIETLICG